MATKIRWRRGTASQWTTMNPVLSSGEAGFETDTGKFKIGNGIADWVSLPYALADSTHSSDTNNPHSVTKEQVGLGAVPNVDATNPSNIVEDASHRFVTDVEKLSWTNKVDQVEGKQLSDENFSLTEKNKLSGIQSGATVNQTDAYLLNRANHSGTQSADTIVEDATHRFATDSEKTAWNAKADSSTVSAHTSDTNNPHVVTKDQVGLSNVPNVDATNPANIVEDATHRFVTDAEKVAWNSAGASFTEADVRETDLEGLDTALTGSITALDTVITGFGKTQNQLNASLRSANNLSDVGSASTARSNIGAEPTITGGTSAQFWNGLKAWTDFATTVRASVLTGLSTATNSVILAADTVLVALGKAQAQINSLANRVNNLEFYQTPTYYGYTTQSYSTTSTTYSAVGSGILENYIQVSDKPYIWEFYAVFRTPATTTGVGFRMGTGASGTPAIPSQFYGKWTISQAVNGVDKNFDYDQTSFSDNITSTAVLAANTDYVVKGTGIVMCGAGLGAITPEFRTEVNNSAVTVQAGAVFTMKILSTGFPNG